MIVTFEKDYLQELYESGVCKDKKHRYQPDIIKKYRKCISYLKQANCKEELFTYNSLHFESLKGDKAGLFSIRAGVQYRIEFTLEEKTKEELILTICNIVELSNHYD